MTDDYAYRLELLERVIDRGVTAEVRTLGISMFPLMPPHSVVHVAPCNGLALRRGDVVVFRRSDGGAVSHRVLHVDASTISTRGDSNLNADAPVAPTDVIGKVVAVRVFGRFVSADGRLLRAYAHVVLGCAPVSNYICYGLARVALAVHRCLRPFVKSSR